MYYAVDKATGRQVSADEAARNRWSHRRYLCPVCHKPVQVRAGEVNSAYFAHKIGEASVDCENYHPGGDYDGPRGPQRPYAAPLRPLGVYVAVEGAPNKKQAWKAELLLPRSPSPRGTVYVPAGRSGPIPVVCSHLTNHGRRIPVKVVSDSYTLRVSSDVDPDYSRKLSVLTPGFAPDAVSIFRYSESGGRRLEEHSPIYWGRGYYVVWPRALALSWPSRLWRDDLRDVGAWSAARIELPANEDYAIARWADEYLSRDVQKPPVTLSLVYPPTALRLEDETLLVRAGESVIVGITGEHGSAIPESLEVHHSSVQGISNVTLPDELPLLIDLGPLPSGLLNLALTDDDETELVLQLAEASAPPGVLTPTIGYEQDQKHVVVPVYSTAAEAALQDARLNRLTLSDLYIIPGMPLSLRMKGGLDGFREVLFEWDASTIASRPSDYALAIRDEVMAALLNALKSNDCFDLDFANYGQLALAAEMHLPSSMSDFRLGSALRNRLIWLTSVARLSVVGEVVMVPYLDHAVDYILNAHAHSREDRSLLNTVRQQRSWPKSLLSHIYDIANIFSALQRTKQ